MHGFRRRLGILLVCSMVLVGVIGWRFTSTKVHAQQPSNSECQHTVVVVSPMENGSPSKVESVSCADNVASASSPEEYDVFVNPDAMKNPHCVAQIEPLSNEKELHSQLKSLSCYPSFKEAILAATNGQVTVDGDNIDPDQLGEQLNTLNSTTSSTIIGIHWEHPQYSTAHGGRTWTYTSAYTSPCTGRSYGVPTMADPVANDVVSSAHAYSNCTSFENYQHSSWSGLNINCTPACPAMGAMNDQTSSWRIDNVIP